MKIWRVCRERYAAEAFSGEGARRYGGRWNSRGVPMVYASTSLALASIELFVHLEPNDAPADLVAISAELPAGEPAEQWTDAVLPQNWWGDEPGPMREMGDTWIRSQACLAVLVPSVPIRSELNVLLNPLRPEMRSLKVDPAQPFFFDSRMFASG